MNNIKVGSWARSFTLIALFCALTFKGTTPEGSSFVKKFKHKEKTSNSPASMEEACDKPKPEDYFISQNTQTPLAATSPPTCDHFCTLTGNACPSTSNTCSVPTSGCLLCPSATTTATCCGACTKDGTNVCCSTLGQSCTSDDQCCDFPNQICPNQKCCLKYGHAGKCGKGSNGDCCSGVCRGITCCGRVGDACGVQEDCCDANNQDCQPDSSGNKRCCVLAGNQCIVTDNEGCCGGGQDCKQGVQTNKFFCCVKPGNSCSTTCGAACCDGSPCGATNNTCPFPPTTGTTN